MSHALSTFIAPLRPDRIGDAEAAIDLLGNPARQDIKAALDRLEPPPGTPAEAAVPPDEFVGTHFASLHAIRSSDGKRAYILLEFSADGTPEDALRRVLDAIGERLRPVFMLAQDWRDGADLASYLTGHRVDVGSGFFDNPGVAFAGTPGMTVGRIRAEGKLATDAAELLDAHREPMAAFARLQDVRSKLPAEHAYALLPAPGQAPFEPLSTAGFIARLLGGFVTKYLWPFLLLVLAWSVYSGLQALWLQHGFWRQLAAFLVGAFGGLAIAIVVLVLALGAVYLVFRRGEDRDPLDENAPDRSINAAMFERENYYAQNHMISVTQRKPGLIRAFTARLAFWVVGEAATYFYHPGFLSDIGTIHFARWVTPPKSPDLIFLSNYGGSWESYLEDFITRAHAGLTGIWSNSIGFPRSENLFQKGATDGERFKRYARRSMAPTRFWYSAYPSLTTDNIRTNADIRRGLSGAMTEEEADTWLALFGSAARPVEKLVSSEIQSIVFGGLGFMPFGACLVVELPEKVDAARRWLQFVSQHIAYNDGRRLRRTAIVTLALGARGLERLGLPEEGLATFPFAFLDGMTSAGRARILGDFGENGSEHWRWGRTPADAVLLVYGETPGDVAGLEESLSQSAADLGMAAFHRIPLRRVSTLKKDAQKKGDDDPQKNKREPFGFVDGISQPVIRGTYKGLRNADPIHLVEPGEFILGYPDNRGNIPPGPTLAATLDPANKLPLVSGTVDFSRTVVENQRDIGFNGSFLVVRELEQDVARFWDYCGREAAHLASRLPQPYVINKEFIAAKLIGRWTDGSSLMRYPYEPQTIEGKRARARTTASFGPAAAAQAVAPAARATVRPRSKPATAASQPIEQPSDQGSRTDNDFLFGTEDPEALRCPFGSHIRRANPRDSLDPGSQDQIDISNRHRVIRVGRPLDPEHGQTGLLFMCLNGDIERQFEFLQQSWLRSPSFHGLSCEKDPVLGDGEAGVCSYTIPTRDGPVRLSPMPRFVTTKGGGYFFLPGKRLVEYLCAPL
ncbi:MAG: Dyp-type peroxidase [Microvirga sp.]